MAEGARRNEVSQTQLCLEGWRKERRRRLPEACHTLSTKAILQTPPLMNSQKVLSWIFWLEIVSELSPLSPVIHSPKVTA